MKEAQILYEDRDVLAMMKMPGIASESRRVGEIDMLTLARRHCRGQTESSREETDGRKALPGHSQRQAGAPGAASPPPFPALIHRLDQPVGGILLFAKNKRAAAILSEELRKGGVGKEYLALCHVLPKGRALLGQGESTAHPDRGEARQDESITLRNHLRKDPGRNMSRIADSKEPGAKEAALSFWTEDMAGEAAKAAFSIWFPESPNALPFLLRDPDLALLRVDLMTGRHHQIRLQLSHAGLPVLGDRKYGVSEEVYGNPEEEASRPRGLCLLSCRLSFTHPATGERLEIHLP